MAIEAIDNINEVCNTSINPDRIEVDVYFYGSPRLGMILYSDHSKKVRSGAGIFGLKYNDKIYKVRTDASGIVVQFDGECIAATLPQRFIGYQTLNIWEIDNGNVALVNSQIDDMVAAGANFLHLAINMDGVFKSNAELIANSPSKWVNNDAFFSHAASKNLTVGIRVNLGTDDQYIPNFWGWDNHQKDEWGYDCTVYYGGGHSSLSYAPGVAMMIDFVSKVTERYAPLFGNNLYFIQPSLTEQDEYGGNFKNQQWPNPEYMAMYDYSTVNKNAFKAKMELHYGTIANLKSAWGSVANTWTSFSDIVVPSTGLSNRFESSTEAIRNGMAGKRGEDWIKFQHDTYWSFAEECRNAIHAINPNIKLSLNFGSGNDGISLMRFSYNMKDWSRIADIIQSDFSARNTSDTIDSISADWMNSLGNKPKYSEIADFDAGSYYSHLSYARAGFDNGLTFMSVISEKSNLENWSKYLLLVRTLADEYSNKPVVAPATEGSINVTWSECIHNWPAIEERWRSAGGSKTKRILINFTEDL